MILNAATNRVLRYSIEWQRDVSVCCPGETEATAFLDILMKSNVTLPRTALLCKESHVTVPGRLFKKESIVTKACIGAC